MVRRATSSASVPLSGFLNPSAVSWQTRVPRPCFVPQPPLIATFRAFPSLAVVHPSRGDWLPCRYPPACNDAPPPTLSPAVSPTPTPESAVAWFPRRLWVPFPRARKPASRSPWIEGDGTAMFRQLHRLRSFPPAASPFARRRVAPPPRPMLAWPSAPSEFVPRPSEPRTPPNPKARSRRSARDEPAPSAARPRGPQPPQPGGTSSPTRMKVSQPARQSPALFRTGPRHLSVTSPSPSTFARRSPVAVALGASK